MDFKDKNLSRWTDTIQRAIERHPNDFVFRPMKMSANTARVTLRNAINYLVFERPKLDWLTFEAIQIISNLTITSVGNNVRIGPRRIQKSESEPVHQLELPQIKVFESAMYLPLGSESQFEKAVELYLQMQELQINNIPPLKIPASISVEEITKYEQQGLSVLKIGSSAFFV
jgi:hypothetical protein